MRKISIYFNFTIIKSSKIVLIGRFLFKFSLIMVRTMYFMFKMFLITFPKYRTRTLRLTPIWIILSRWKLQFWHNLFFWSPFNWFNKCTSNALIWRPWLICTLLHHLFTFSIIPSISWSWNREILIINYFLCILNCNCQTLPIFFKLLQLF